MSDELFAEKSAKEKKLKFTNPNDAFADFKTKFAVIYGRDPSDLTAARYAVLVTDSRPIDEIPESEVRSKTVQYLSTLNDVRKYYGKNSTSLFDKPPPSEPEPAEPENGKKLEAMRKYILDAEARLKEKDVRFMEYGRTVLKELDSKEAEKQQALKEQKDAMATWIGKYNKIVKNQTSEKDAKIADYESKTRDYESRMKDYDSKIAELETKLKNAEAKPPATPSAANGSMRQLERMSGESAHELGKMASADGKGGAGQDVLSSTRETPATPTPGLHLPQKTAEPPKVKKKLKAAAEPKPISEWRPESGKWEPVNAEQVGEAPEAEERAEIDYCVRTNIEVRGGRNFMYVAGMKAGELSAMKKTEPEKFEEIVKRHLDRYMEDGRITDGQQVDVYEGDNFIGRYNVRLTLRDDAEAAAEAKADKDYASKGVDFKGFNELFDRMLKKEEQKK